VLTKSSVLHYWSSRYGVNPRIGGRPIYTRNSAGLFTSQEGEVDSAIVNTPRFDWSTLNLPNSLTERRKLLTLELARTNSTTNASDATQASWTKNLCTALKNAIGPDGIANSASTLTATATNAYASAGGSGSIGAGGTTSMSGYVRKGSTQFAWVGDGGDAPWHRFWIDLDSAAVSSATGTTRATAEKIGNGWIKWTITFVLTNTYTPQVFSGMCSATNTTTCVASDTLQVAVADHEVSSLFATSPIQTVAAGVTRAADSFYWNYLPVPQALMMYMRFVERGSVLSSGLRILAVTTSAGANPELAIAASAGFYIAYQNSATSTVAIAPNIGDTVDLALLVLANGQCLIIQAINGAPVTAGVTSGVNALPAAWADTKLWLNSEGIVSTGAGGYAEVKIVKYADVVAVTNQGIMDELRAFELGAGGDVL
jgi:hypothetical protein